MKLKKNLTIFIIVKLSILSFSWVAFAQVVDIGSMIKLPADTPLKSKASFLGSYSVVHVSADILENKAEIDFKELPTALDVVGAYLYWGGRVACSINLDTEQGSSFLSSIETFKEGTPKEWTSIDNEVLFDKTISFQGELINADDTALASAINRKGESDNKALLFYSDGSNAYLDVFSAHYADISKEFPALVAQAESGQFVFDNYDFFEYFDNHSGDGVCEKEKFGLSLYIVFRDDSNINKNISFQFGADLFMPHGHDGQNLKRWISQLDGVLGKPSGQICSTFGPNDSDRSLLANYVFAKYKKHKGVKVNFSSGALPIDSGKNRRSLVLASSGSASVINSSSEGSSEYQVAWESSKNTSFYLTEVNTMRVVSAENSYSCETFKPYDNTADCPVSNASECGEGGGFIYAAVTSIIQEGDSKGARSSINLVR